MPPVPGTTTKILPGMGNTRGIMTPLIPFNLIVDTDFGMLNLINREYRDDDVFNTEYFHHKLVRDMTRDLYERKTKNPLYLILREEYYDMADEFYNQFMDREYSKILDLSVRTELYRVIGSFNSSEEISTTILCNNKEELNVMLEYNNTRVCDIVMSDSLSSAEISKHNQFYFKSTEDAIPYMEFLKSKTVYIADYGFNRDDSDNSLVMDEVSILLITQRNMVRLADIYSPAKLR